MVQIRRFTAPLGRWERRAPTSSDWSRESRGLLVFPFCFVVIARAPLGCTRGAWQCRVDGGLYCMGSWMGLGCVMARQGRGGRWWCWVCSVCVAVHGSPVEREAHTPRAARKMARVPPNRRVTRGIMPYYSIAEAVKRRAGIAPGAEEERAARAKHSSEAGRACRRRRRRRSAGQGRRAGPRTAVAPFSLRCVNDMPC